ncbi:MAG: SulP family inorganic anion transporter, partial [Bacteroidetes bacterium]
MKSLSHSKLARYLPFLTWLPRVNRRTLRDDIIAGLTGTIISLPQGVAFAIIAGMPPIYGLYSAMVMPIITA